MELRTESLGDVRFGVRVLPAHCAAEDGMLLPHLAKHHPAQLRELLRQHGLLVFSHRGALEPRLMAAVMSRLGSLSQCNASRSARVVEGVPDAPSMAVPGLPFIRRLGNIVDPVTGVPQALHCRTGYEWHSDGEQRLTMLSCTEAPQSGGETLFASSHEIYANLSPDDRAQADGAIAVYGSKNTSGGPSAFDCERGLRMSAEGTRLLRPVASKPDGWRRWECRKPLVRSSDAHGFDGGADGDESDSGSDSSSTQRRFITVDMRHFLHFEYLASSDDDDRGSSSSSSSSDSGSGSDTEEPQERQQERRSPRLASLSPEDSQELLSRWLLATLQPRHPVAALDPVTLLPAHGQCTHFSPQTVYSHRWQVGDVLLWDNDALIHTATPTSLVEGRRLMYQIIMKKSSKNAATNTATRGNTPLDDCRSETSDAGNCSSEPVTGVAAQQPTRDAQDKR